MLQSVMNIETAYAKALLIDDAVLTSSQGEGDVLGAHRALTDAFETDVRPLLARWRTDKGLDPDPVRAFRDGGYAEQRARERGTAQVESAYEKQ
jgi:L-rhamnose isomerase / sugar isomerase